MSKVKRTAQSPGSSTQSRARPQEPALSSLIEDILEISQPITVDTIRKGFHPRVVKHLSRALDIPNKRTLGLLNLSNQSYSRRQKLGRLTTIESDHVWRIANITARAYELFDDKKAAAEWLGAPNPYMGGESPLGMTDTSVGTRDVEQLIGRITHGIPS